MISFKEIITALEQAFSDQVNAVSRWHMQEPEIPQAVQTDTDGISALTALQRLVSTQHLMNFKLWHVEDVARRKDVGPEVIAQCKHSIDAYNQQRNDYMEKIDIFLESLLQPILPSEGKLARINTESPAMAVDRLSILSLKIYHMHEQVERLDASEAHREGCREKLCVLQTQRYDLCSAVYDLLDDYARGVKRPKTYYQFKMYNDPELNPELYANKAGRA